MYLLRYIDSFYNPTEPNIFQQDLYEELLMVVLNVEIVNSTINEDHRFLLQVVKYLTYF